MIMRWMRYLLTMTMLLLSACNLTTQPPTAETELPTLPPSARPVVTINAPKTGDEFVVGKEIFVTGSARDSVGVTRVQLLANKQIVKTVSSETASGQTNFDVLLDYTPRAEGSVSLELVAYRGAIASDPAVVQINVRNTPAQVTATVPQQPNIPVIDPNDPTCRILTSVALNLRTGPATTFDRLTTLPAGTVAPVVGRTANNQWLQVRFGTQIGWVSAQNPSNPNETYVGLYGNCFSVPVINVATPTVSNPTLPPTWTPPPTATRAPTSTPGLPDLVVTAISGETAVTIPPSAVEVTRTYAATISNLGGSPTGSFKNQAILPGGTQADLGVVSNLNAGESIILTFNVSFNAAGNYTIQVIPDSDNQVTEVSEVNNNGTITVNVTGP